MSNTPILNLPVAVSLDGSEYAPVVQGGTTKRAQTSLFDLTGGSGGSVQSPNTVFAGPASGAAAPPSFRALVAGDLPTVPATKGGTGLTSYTTGDIIYAASSSTLAALADVATGNALLAGGVGTAPAWGKIDLTTTVTGILPVANGGTGSGTASGAFDAIAPTTTQGDLIYRNATTNTRLAASTSGYHLQTNGAGTDPTWAGFLQAGTSAVTRTWLSKAQAVINPRDFGAVGDGVTDDAAAINAAITYAASLTSAGSGGFVVVDGQGLNYAIQSAAVQVVAKSGVILANMGVKVLSGFVSDRAISFNGSGNPFACWHSGAVNVRVDVNWQSDIHGIAFVNTYACFATECEVVHFSPSVQWNLQGIGIFISGSNPSLRIRDCDVFQYNFGESGYNVYTNRTGTGVYVNSADIIIEGLTAAYCWVPLRYGYNVGGHRISDSHLYNGLAVPPSQKTISGVADNGSGGVRITTSTAHGYSTNDNVIVYAIGDSAAAELNNPWIITVIDATNFDLVGAVWPGSATVGASTGCLLASEEPIAVLVDVGAASVMMSGVEFDNGVLLTGSNDIAVTSGLFIQSANGYERSGIRYRTTTPSDAANGMLVFGSYISASAYNRFLQWQALAVATTVTITIASPGVITWTKNGFIGYESVVFSTTGALPTGLTAGVTYYVVPSSITTNTFQVSATVGGAAITTSGSQSGIQTATLAGSLATTLTAHVFGNIFATGSDVPAEGQWVIPKGSLTAPGLVFSANPNSRTVDGNTGLYQPIEDTVGVVIAAVERARFTSTGILFPSGSIIDFASDVTITHSADALTFAGATSGFKFSNPPQPTVASGTNLGTSTAPWAAFYTGTIELGAATDTTISRVSAGVVAVEGSNILLASGLGSITQAYDADLAALAANSTNGLWARTGAGTGSARTITQSIGITVTDGDGVSGNPTIAWTDWATIASGSLSGSRLTLSSIAATYRELMLIIVGGSQDTAAANWTFEISEDNGGSWASVTRMSSLIATAAVTNYGIILSNYTSTSATRPKVVFYNRYDTVTPAPLAGGTNFYASTSVINAVSVAISAGSFDAGTYYLMGR